MNSYIKSKVYLILLGIQTACCFILDSQSPSTLNMTSAAATANTAATTTQKLPHTAPPVPVTCNVCAGPEFLCEKLFAPQTCFPPNNYCINKFYNHIDGTRMVTRHCGNFDTCYRDWFLGSSDSDRCRNFEDNNIITLDFDCTYCCTTDNCNKPIKPLDKDLYKVPQSPPTVKMTSTATTSIKATTNGTTAATTETTTAASIPKTATTTTQKLPYTAPPVAVTCNVCAGPEFLCEQLFAPQTCNPPNNYCINKLTNHIDGTRMVTRHCGNFDTCYRDWFLRSSDSDRCRNFEDNNIITLDFDCTYCCTTDNCNKPIKPLDKDLYKDAPAVTITSTATTSIKAATTENTTATTTSTIAATTETTTAASIPNTATTTTQKLPHTAPPVAVICNVCAGPEFLCDKLFAPQTCYPPNNYCINKLSNHRDGTRMVTRHCGNFDTCYREWFLGSSDSDRCHNFEENNIITLDFDCTYCCTSDNCNKPIKPLKEDLYHDI